MTVQLIEAYYRAFNARDYDEMLALMSDEVVHDINQGAREEGKDTFAAFLERMDRTYREQLIDIVIMANADGTRFAAEFTVIGKYIETDPGFVPARGQSYRLPAGAFFEVDAGMITRVTTYYNLKDWLEQVGG
ncbi:MAG TPA: ketosteroid isomerase-related protein [Polyangiales bacterium]